MNKYSVGLVLTLIACLVSLGVYLGATLFPRVETKTVEVERVQKDVVTVTKEVVRPDGTREIISTMTDKSKESSTKTATVMAPKDWHISVSDNRTSLTSADVYGLQIERRVLGDISMSVRVQTDKSVGLVVGLEF
jgi:hypothetical protein